MNLFCESCLQRFTDDITVHKYLLRNEILKNVIKRNYLYLCAFCKKLAQNTEVFLDNVKNAESILKASSKEIQVDGQLKKVRNLEKSEIHYLEILPDEVRDDVKEEIGDVKHETYTTPTRDDYAGEHGDDADELYVKLEGDEMDFSDDDGLHLSNRLSTEMNDLKQTGVVDEIKFHKPVRFKERKKKKKRHCLFNADIIAEDLSGGKSIKVDIEDEVLLHKLMDNRGTSEKRRKYVSQYASTKKVEIIKLTKKESVRKRDKMAADALYLDAPFKCGDCLKGFAYKETYDNHMMLHEDVSGVYACDICRQRRRTAESLAQHVALHFKVCRCTACGLTRGSRKSIVEHYNSEHLDKLYYCRICCKKFSQESYLLKHNSRKHPAVRRRVTCDLCKRSYTSMPSLRKHLAVKHAKETSAPARKKDYICLDCGKAFVSNSALAKHALSHTDAKDYFCVECDKNYKSADGLKQHLQGTLIHGNKTSLRFPCDYCNLKFMQKRNRDNHMNAKHLNIKPFPCGQCDKTYTASWSLNHHIRKVHDGVKKPYKFPCSLCDKVFQLRATLKEHIRTHTGERPFACNICSAKFTQSGILRTHQKLIHFKVNRKTSLNDCIKIKKRLKKED